MEFGGARAGRDMRQGRDAMRVAVLHLGCGALAQESMGGAHF